VYADEYVHAPRTQYLRTCAEGEAVDGGGRGLGEVGPLGHVGLGEGGTWRARTFVGVRPACCHSSARLLHSSPRARAVSCADQRAGHQQQEGPLHHVKVVFFPIIFSFFVCMWYIGGTARAGGIRTSDVGEDGGHAW
jgi:hypothetical protein